MKVETHKNSELTRLCELVEGMSVAMLTITDESWVTASRPMSPILMDSEGAIWFFTERSLPKTSQLLKLNLSFSGVADSTYVYISGHREFSADCARIDSLNCHRRSNRLS
jgi:general stress protein 26